MVLISINGCKLANTTIWTHICLLEEGKAKNTDVTVTDIENIRKLIQSGTILNASIDKTFFRQKDVYCFYNSNYLEYRAYKEKELKSLRVVTEYKLIDNLTFGYLKNNLPAKDFLEYCRQEMYPLEVVIKESPK